MSRFPAFPPEYRTRWIEKGLWLDRTLPQYLDEAVGEVPDKVAIVFPDPRSGREGARPYLDPLHQGDATRIPFRAWKDLAEDLAAGLLARGIGFEDIVTVQLPNWPEMCLLQIALARIGAVIQPMHVTYRQREMQSMLRFCESAAVFLCERFGGFEHAAALREIHSDLPDLRLTVTCGGAGTGDFPTFRDLMEEGRTRRDLLDRHSLEHPPSADHVFYLNFTSGTEGEPKGFLHTHNTLLSPLKRFAELQARYNKKASEQVALAASPMTHSFGHLTTYGAIFSRSQVVLLEKFEPGQVLRLIERERVTALSGTPAHLIGLLQHPDFAKTDISSVKSVGVGGAGCPVKLMADIESTFGVKLGNTYGMGENIVHTRTLPNDPPEIIRDTVGKPVPGAELAIFSEDHSRELATGEIGEIAFRGPSLFLAYFKKPEQTAATRNADGWFFTGDLGFVDAAGYLHLAGRKKEMINRGGTKIFPKEIEDLLLLHPKVGNVAVVGMPDYRLGEKICAYVVAKPGAAPTLAELCEFLESQKVMKNKLPERLELVSELPMTPTGKIKKQALAEDIARKVGSLPV